MKTHRPAESTLAARFRRRASENPPPRPPRVCLVLGDPTDCLLDAYDCVARRAYENFLAHGARAGGELQDWLSAERQLLLDFPIDVQETDDFIYALASVPGATAARISLGIESQWMVILVRQAPGAVDATDAARPAPAALRVAANSARPRAPLPSEVRRAANSPAHEGGAKSVCVMGLPCAVDAARSIAVLGEGVLGIRMAKLHPGA